jgi:hypothetical protein
MLYAQTIISLVISLTQNPSLLHNPTKCWKWLFSRPFFLEKGMVNTFPSRVLTSFLTLIYYNINLSCIITGPLSWLGLHPRLHKANPQK